MQKQNKKTNILDFVIILAIALSIVALFARDIISEAFGKPEIVTLEMTVTTEKLSDENAQTLESGKTLVITTGSEVKTSIDAKISSVKANDNGSVTLVLSCTGYKRLARYYTELNQKIEINTDCTVKIAETEFKGRLSEVKVGG